MYTMHYVLVDKNNAVFEVFTVALTKTPVFWDMTHADW
jgi:hypothetical protein